MFRDVCSILVFISSHDWSLSVLLVRSGMSARFWFGIFRLPRLLVIFCFVGVFCRWLRQVPRKWYVFVNLFVVSCLFGTRIRVCLCDAQFQTPLGEDDLNKIAVWTLTDSDAVELKAAGRLCYICLGEYSADDKLRVLSCGHEMHCSCLDRWLGSVHGVRPAFCSGFVAHKFTLCFQGVPCM